VPAQPPQPFAFAIRIAVLVDAEVRAVIGLSLRVQAALAVGDADRAFDAAADRPPRDRATDAPRRAVRDALAVAQREIAGTGRARGRCEPRTGAMSAATTTNGINVASADRSSATAPAPRARGTEPHWAEVRDDGR
jgi:hypothetical protein